MPSQLRLRILIRVAFLMVACPISTIIIITKRFEKMVEALVFRMLVWNLARTPETVATIPGRSRPTAVSTSLSVACVIKGHLKAQFMANVLQLLTEPVEAIDCRRDVDQ